MALKIKVRGGGSPEPEERLPPGERRGTAIINPGRHNPPDLPVYVTREALTGMLHHAKRGGDVEIGGFLLGGYHRHEGDPYVDITTYVPALKAESARTHLTFSNEAQREFHATHAERYPGTTVLGWYHTHPGYSVFLSEYDLFIQRGFFAAPHHVAVVVDPFQFSPHKRMGVFVWEQGRISDGYHLIAYESDGSARR